MFTLLHQAPESSSTHDTLSNSESWRSSAWHLVWASRSCDCKCQFFHLCRYRWKERYFFSLHRGFTKVWFSRVRLELFCFLGKMRLGCKHLPLPHQPHHLHTPPPSQTTLTLAPPPYYHLYPLSLSTFPAFLLKRSPSSTTFSTILQMTL